MRPRRTFFILAALGLALLLANNLQNWVYIHRAPLIPRVQELGHSGSETLALLVAGEGMDDTENATCLRDLDAAARALSDINSEKIIIKSLHPKQEDYSKETLLKGIAANQSERLVLFFTGHGGGKNFGASNGLNISRQELARAIKAAKFETALVVIDCCWSGEFKRSFDDQAFERPVTLITSTDARHPAPFPVSFLSPKSFGRMYFERLEQGEREAFDLSNSKREGLRWLFPKEFGLVGEYTRYPNK